MQFALKCALICSLGLAGCGGSGGSTISSITNPPPVNAQTGYSNASISGSYAIGVSGTVVIGTVKADGNGNITGGTLTYVYGSSTSGDTPNCNLSVTGTYSVKSDGSGIATLQVAPGQTNPCTGTNYPSATLNSEFLLMASQQGSSVYLVNNSLGILASKQ